MDSAAATSSSSPLEDPIDLTDIPIRALNVSCRSKLSLLLNPLTITDIDGYNRDYRGLAELLEFEHDHIVSFQRDDDPTAKILSNWEYEAGSTVGVLFKHLTYLDRTDVIDEIKPIAERNARQYLRRVQNNQVMPVQVNEVSSQPLVEMVPDDPDHLTLADAAGCGPEIFDAYVCYADLDFEFVQFLCAGLESWGIRLCIKDRNILPSRFEDDSILRIIRERCQRMLLIWSPEFSRSAQCGFLTRFATGLTVEQKKNKIIPVIYKDHPMPPSIQFLSKVDYARTHVQCWFWRRLIFSVKQGDKTFISNYTALSDLPEIQRPMGPAGQLQPPPYVTCENPLAIRPDNNNDPIVQLPAPTPDSLEQGSLISLNQPSSASNSSENKSTTKDKRNKVQQFFNKITRPKKEATTNL